MIKLVRLARIPRLMKLLDTNKFKRALDSIANENPNIKEIQQMHRYLTYYNAYRLLFIMMFMVYGIGCIFFLLSDSMNDAAVDL